MSLLLCQGDALQLPLQEQSVQCCVTSPPYYGLRDYGVEGQLGSEAVHDCAGAFTGDKCEVCYVCHIREVFREVWRVLRNDGTVWLNLGDSYTSGGRVGHGTRQGCKQQSNRGMNGTNDPPRAPQPQGLAEKNLMGMPWRVALALQADGWTLRSEIIWHKTNPMPESVRDRPTKGHEQVFLLTKGAQYFYDANAIREPHADVKVVNGHYVGSGANVPGYIPHTQGFNGSGIVMRNREYNSLGRNVRSVWSIPSEPMSLTSETSRLASVVKDVVFDDTMCRVSADCPIHGGLVVQASNAPCDVRASVLFRRTVRTEIDPAQAQIVGSVPTVPQLAVVIVAENSGCVLHSYAQPAIAHNTQIRKKVRDAETTWPYTSSAQSDSHTGRMSTQPDLCDSVAHIPASNTAEDFSVDGQETGTDQTGTHIVCTYTLTIPPECLCIFYTISTEKSSHFATMPTALAARCIQAGTSAAGACPQCGRPYVRQVERGSQSPAYRPTNQPIRSLAASAAGQGTHGTAQSTLGMVHTTCTTGWTPSCICNAGDPLPCTVLDPFVGSGTTLLVARQLGRHGIGMDLSFPYLQLARARCGLEALHAWQHGAAAVPQRFNDLPLFAEEPP